MSLGTQSSQSYKRERIQVGLSDCRWSKSERMGNSMSWRSSQQAPQWVGLAWKPYAHLLQAPTVLMCKYATYVWTALIFIHYAGVNPYKNNVSTTGNATIKHSRGCCCLSAQPTCCQESGMRVAGLWGGLQGTAPDCSLSWKISGKVEGRTTTDTASSH